MGSSISWDPWPRPVARAAVGTVRSVHRSAKMAPRRRFGAFVYTVAPWAWVVGGLGIAIVYTNGRIGSLGAVSGHLCTLLRRESRYESRRELRQVARAPQPPRRAGGAPSLAPPAWSGRQALHERRRREVGVFAEASTHTNPRSLRKNCNMHQEDGQGEAAPPCHARGRVEKVFEIARQGGRALPVCVRSEGTLGGHLLMCFMATAATRMMPTCWPRAGPRPQPGRCRRPRASGTR